MDAGGGCGLPGIWQSVRHDTAIRRYPARIPNADGATGAAVASSDDGRADDGNAQSRRHDRRRRDGARVDGTRDSHARRGHARSNANAGHADECHTRRAAALARTKTICERAWGPCSALYRTNGKGGPTDLTRTYGNSDATWSRELDTLSGTGLIYKRGQKYVLTELGQGWAQQQ